MIEIEDMRDADAREVFTRIGYGHLGCCSDNKPYVVPIHYAYNGEFVHIYTTEGRKAEILEQNPEICLQAEEVESSEIWRSVMVFGSVERLVNEDQRQAALDLILEHNPKLTPAISIRWMDGWVRENIEAIYRFRPTQISGRQTVYRSRPTSSLGKPRSS